MKKERLQHDMTQGPILKGLIYFAIPFLIGNLFQEFYTMTDSLIVGNFCDAYALAAIGSAENPSKILLNVFLGFSTATTILMAGYFGAGKEDKMSEVTAASNMMLWLFGLPLAIVLIFLAPSILKLINVEEGKTMDDALRYMQILLIGTPLMMGYNQNAGILRGLGDSRSPLYFLILSSVTNVALDFLFVAMLGLGVGGAAAATVIAQGVSFVISIFYIRRRYEVLHYRLFTRQIKGQHVKDILRVGLPLGINNAVYPLGHTVVSGMINGYGSAAMAGYTCAKRIDSLIMMPMLSMGNAMTTYVGQNAGAGKRDRIRKGIGLGTLTNIGVTVVLCVLVLIFRTDLIRMFNRDPKVIASGIAYLERVVPFYFMYALYNSMNCSMNGAEEVIVPTASSLLMFFAVRLPIMGYFSAHYSLEVMYWSFPLSWIFGLAFSGIYFLSGRWKRHLPPESTE